MHMWEKQTNNNNEKVDSRQRRGDEVRGDKGRGDKGRGDEGRGDEGSVFVFRSLFFCSLAARPWVAPTHLHNN